MIPSSKFFLIITFLFAGHISYSQNRAINRDNYKIHISKTESEISMDGILDEDFWEYAEMVSQFHRVLPTDTGFAIAQTEIRVCYNDDQLFVGIVCYDPSPGKRPVESLRRDFSFGKNDNFIVFIDTYNDQTNGFAFGISPAGAQWDGIQSDGGKVNLDWDTKWRSVTRNYDDKWTAEFAIPFRSLRYNGGAPEWGINFSRQDLKTGEKSSWAPMPRQFATATLSYTGSLVWDKPLPGSGPRFSIIPYASAKASQETSNSSKINTSASAGMDAKVILSTAMNLDLTLNPDYSQVEVDKQQTNLDRYELFFPEKRQFFLENSDLFANLGEQNLRPFFSRRIGIDSPVQAGARLSGKIGDNWRIGLMDMQTGKKELVPSTNYSVAAIERKVLKRSTVSAFMVNRQYTSSEQDSIKQGNYNSVAGAEFDFSSADNKWIGKTFYHHSFQEGSAGNSSVLSANLSYASQYLAASLNQSLVGENFNADVGYIRRKGYYQIKPLIKYFFFPENSSIAKHGPALGSDIFYDKQMNLTDRDIQLSYRIDWLNKSSLEAEFKDTFLKLLFPFDPTNSGGASYDMGDSFKWKEFSISYTSDIRKSFNLMVKSRYGGFFEGTKLSFDSELYYRIQPFSSLAIVSSINKIDLPEPYSSANFILLGPRLDITFTNKIFFTGLVQYNNQIDNLNFNLRFQWRFAPVSDLYIVYTENANPLNYKVKSRGLVIKLSYWFN